MEHFFNVIKVFIEKHLIPTIVSVVLTVVSILLFPSLSLIQNKTGQALFWLFIFCCWFLIIHFIIWFVKTTESRMYLLKRADERNEEGIANINNFFDDLSPSDKDIIVGFISRNNLPLRDLSYYSYDDNILGNRRELFNVTPTPAGMEKGTYWVSSRSRMQYSKNSSFETDGSYLYKLKEVEYNELRSVYLKQGKLGNF